MTTKRVGVVADDLTGATDTTLAFWQHGFATFILLDATSTTLPEGDAVVTIDTDSRHRNLQESATRVTEAVRSLQATGVDRFYKKIDSTMRGNPGAEIEAMMSATGISHALICPAFPQMGRTVIEGRVLVWGQDLTLTPAASDPRSPVTTSHIAEILAKQTTLPIEELTLADLAHPGEQVALRSDKHMTILDARTDEDLLRWVRYFGTDPHVLWVGSAGLAGILAGETGKTGTHSENSQPTTLTAAPAVLVVVGSIHTASREQVARLHTFPDVRMCPVEPASLLVGTQNTWLLAHEIRQALEGGQHCVLYTQDSPEIAARLQSVLKTLRHNYVWSGGEIARRLSEIVYSTLPTITRPVNLVLTGGDTAKSTLASLGVDMLRVVQMVAPGTPVCETPDRKRRVVTKAGGFGGPDILLQAIHALTSR